MAKAKSPQKKKQKNENKGEKTLILLDSHAILHRSYHALPDFSSEKGEPTGALYGLFALLIKVIRELKPDYLVACYDLPEPTFRHKEYDAYKAGRKKPDDELIAQIIRSKYVFESLDIPIYELAGFEADDMIGTIAEECRKKKDVKVIIASGDMDTLQLADEEKVAVYTLRKGLSDTVLYDKKAVHERYGFDPEYLPDFKGLSGDKSDNIPGVTGIGEKSATELIQKFGTVENIFQELEKGEEHFVKKGIKKRVFHLLEDHEDEALFSKELGTIRLDAPIHFSLPKESFWDSANLSKIEKMCDELSFRTLKVRFRALFNEESGKNSGEAVENTMDNKMNNTVDKEDIDPLDFKKAQIALWILNSEISSPTLEDMQEHTHEKEFQKITDALLKEIKDQKLTKIYDIECAIIPFIIEAEKRGILVDTKYTEKLSNEYHKKLEEYEKKIWKLAGSEFNINSPKQMGEILFEKMALSKKGIKKTAGGAISTRESELEKLRGEHEIIGVILQYREVQKLLSTYIDNIPKMLDKKNRLHTTLNQTGTSTGRMSSSNPNLQNIPVREGLGEAVRDMFVAEQGYQLVSLDYSQIEMRILAEMSGDEHLMKTFQEGRDVHASVASRVFGVPEEKVSKDQRRKAKVINFGIVYGMGVRALRQNLGGTTAEAQDFYDAYFREFPTISEFFEKVKSEARRLGYTETLYGRRRYFPEISSHVPYMRASAERMAVNAPIQGTATGDLVKMAIFDVTEQLKKKKLKKRAFLLLQIHDELLFEVKNEVLEDAIPVIKNAMEEVGDLEVPLKVDVKTGTHWGSLKKYIV